LNAGNFPVPALSVELHRSVAEIGRADWDACFPDEPEGWAYYKALENSGLEAFSWLYLAVRENGRLLAAAPAFVLDYHLDTTIQGTWRAALQPLQSLLTLRLLCLGSPVADTCHIGFAPDLPNARRNQCLGCMIDSAEGWAAAQGIGLLGAKDVSGTNMESGLGAVFAAAGYACQPGLPNAVLALPAGGEDGYLKSLSRGTRREVRRKLRNAERIEVELRCGREALEFVPQIARLYEGQRARSRGDFGPFETLGEQYFRRVLEEQERSLVFLYWHAGRLAAFNLCYHSERLFIDKFIGLQWPLERSLDLYVLSWMNNVRYCLAHGISRMQTGQTAYEMKRHLGSGLEPSWLLFRHRNPLLNAMLRLAGPLLSAERSDPDLRRLAGSTA
jgi:hypothetical protein